MTASPQPQTLTARMVETAKPAPAGKRLELWDANQPGFGLRITDKGAKSWVLMTRIHGRQRRMTLGRYPALELKDARQKARDTLFAISKGEDPTATPDDDTFERVAETYFKRECSKHRRGWETERIIRRELMPVWRDRLITQITRRDIRNIVEAIDDRGKPEAANRLLRIIKAFFNWAIEKDILETSPCARMKPPTKSIERKRVLSEDEISALWNAWDEMAWPFGPFMRLLLVTGQRRNEVAGLEWAEIDFDEALWTIPPERTKSDRVHDVPLSGLALEIIDELPRTDDRYVFPSIGGNGHIQGFSKAKLRADKLSGVTDWRLHDLRRSATSGLARLGVPLPIIKRVLNHSARDIEGVTAIYLRYDYLGERRMALNKWAQWLDSIVGPTSGKVVSLHGG